MRKRDNIITIFIIVYFLMCSIIAGLLQLNFSDKTNAILVIILIVIFIFILLSMCFYESVAYLFIGNILTVFVLFSLLTSIRTVYDQSNIKPLAFLFLFFIITFLIQLINIIMITIRLYNLEKPTLYEENNNKQGKIAKSLFRFLNKIIYKIESLFYKLRFLFPIIIYFFTIMIIILGFAIYYDKVNLNSIKSNLEQGLFYTQSVEAIPTSNMATGWETLYFSTTTFFSVGFGDIYPKGDVLKFVVQIEMIMGHILNVFFIPIFLFFLLKIFEEKPSNYIVKLQHYSDTNTNKLKTVNHEQQ